jgi:hypothetical protein
MTKRRCQGVSTARGVVVPDISDRLSARQPVQDGEAGQGRAGSAVSVGARHHGDQGIPRSRPCKLIFRSRRLHASPTNCAQINPVCARHDRRGHAPDCVPNGGSGSPRLLCILIPGTSIRFVRVRSYDRPDRSIVTVQLDTSMCTLARESWRCATHQGRSSPSIVISGPFTESLGKSSGTLARQSVSQANHDLARRVQPN